MSKKVAFGPISLRVRYSTLAAILIYSALGIAIRTALERPIPRHFFESQILGSQENGTVRKD
jgi:hypothetical protein